MSNGPSRQFLEAIATSLDHHGVAARPIDHLSYLRALHEGLAGKRDEGGDVNASMPPAGPPAPLQSLAPPPAPPPAPAVQPGGAEGFLRDIAAGLKDAGGPAQEPPPQQPPPQEHHDWLASVYKAIADDAKDVAETPGAQSAAPPKAPPPPDVDYAPVGAVGGHPAGEAHVRGPQQEGHMLAALEPPAEAAQRSDFRNQLAAQHEQDVYAQQAEEALRHQEALQAAQAKRQQELAAMDQDYRDAVNRLGTASIDTNRWWANKSTPDKIGTALLVFLGGIPATATGGRNPAYDRVMSEINGDVDTQKFDYQAGLDQLKGKQTAFAQMLDRFGSEDAADAAARAAGIDATMAKVRQLGAQWKGTESANAADDLLAKLAATREQILAEGFKFVPASAGAPRYRVSVRGQLLPGTVSEADAQQIALKHGAEPGERADEALLKGAIEGDVATAKARAERQAAAQQHRVQLPTGEVVTAPNEAEATKLRDGVLAMQRTKQLVADAKKLRESAVFRGDLTARRRLEQIQAQLLTDFGVANKLGALSDTDYAIAKQGTADLFDIGSNVEARLDALQDSSIKTVRDRVKTYEGAAEEAPRASGAMPHTAKTFPTLTDALRDVRNSERRADGGPIERAAMPASFTRHGEARAAGGPIDARRRAKR